MKKTIKTIKKNVDKTVYKVLVGTGGVIAYTVLTPVQYAAGVVEIVKYANEKVNDIYEK